MAKYPWPRRMVQWMWFLPDRLSDRFGDARVFAKWTDPLWELHDRAEVWVGRLSCLMLGHEPERDQCGRPEHDFCAWCKKSMPNAWQPKVVA